MASHSHLSIAIAQINATVGDLAGNAQKIVEFSRRAYEQGARVVLTPELSLCGYPPEDLLLRPAFLRACARELQACAAALADLPGLHVVLGHPQAALPTALTALEPADADVRSKSFSLPRCLNAASVLSEGRVLATYAKRELPNYQVFDERRYFASGREVGKGALVFEVQGVRLGVLICEDAWFDEPAQLALEAGAQALCVLNASPFHVGKLVERELRMSALARRMAVPVVYAHLSGGQDEIVFDGASFALDGHGNILARAPAFDEALLVLQFDPAAGLRRGQIEPPLSYEAQAWKALVTGVRDYIEKNHFPSVLIGLSGGIDSALVLAIAVDALGPQRVRTVMMPSPYTADISWMDAREMAEGLGVRHDEIAIAPEFESFRNSLAPLFEGRPEDSTEENLQARIRGTLLMALSNKFGGLVLTTGNKSEMATGYCTLYGDMAGGFAVIKDVAKTLVYRLARWRNDQPGGPVIPERIITRPPSAELRPDQKDQDSLPPYEVLDGILQRHVEEDEDLETIVAEGFNRADVSKVLRLIKLNEYKRRQSPIGVRITHRAFGRDWRYPVTSKFHA